MPWWVTEVIRVRVRTGFPERIKGRAQRERKDSAVKVTVDVITISVYPNVCVYQHRIARAIAR
jgi:hypothetical protein